MLSMRLKALSACSSCAKDIMRMLSMRLMRFSPKIHQIRAKNNFFLSVLKSPTQIGFVGVINLEQNISCLGPFKTKYFIDNRLGLHFFQNLIGKNQFAMSLYVKGRFVLNSQPSCNQGEKLRGPFLL